MSDGSPAIPVWAQILLAIITTIGTIAVAYISRPQPSPVDARPATPASPVPAEPVSVPTPAPASAPVPVSAPIPTPPASDSPVADVNEATEKVIVQSPEPVMALRSSLQELIGVDIAIGDDLTLLKTSHPGMKWDQVKTVLIGETSGRFLNKVPGKISVRVEGDKVTVVWFEMSHNGGTVRRTVESSNGSEEEKVRNEYDTDYSYSQAASMCAVTTGLRSDIIKALGTATQFDDVIPPSDMREENLTLKYVDFVQFSGKYKIGESILAGVKFHSEAYIKNDASRSGYTNTRTSHRECSLAIIFSKIK